MDDFGLVLNAGSSSLKFCAFRRAAGAAWRLDVRGQIEGIGSSPRLSVKDEAGQKLADEKVTASVRDGRDALDVVAAWFRSRYCGARVVGVRLGSGASLCAIHDGKSVDSTLGFTALDGLCMGTRPGALDPGVVLYLFQQLGLSPSEVEAVLYKKSGLLGISAISHDMRV